MEMRRFGRLLPVVLACLALVPVGGNAYSPPPRRPVPVPIRPPVLRTVDHPPVDGVNSFDNGARDGRRVALTFDADMTRGMLWQLQRGLVGSWYNREVIDILRAEGVPATIFLTGLWAAAYPDEARALAADPNLEIGNHTYDHAAFRVPCYGLGGTLNPGGEIVDGQTTITQVTGVTPRLLRFPGDCYAGPDVALARSAGMYVISGDVRAGDGFNPSVASIVGAVERNTRAGSIVVMHLHGGPNAPNTAPALREVIPFLRGQGFELVTVSTLLGLEPARPVVTPAAADGLAVGADSDSGGQPVEALEGGQRWARPD
ncbi:MAG: hypothetical protein NVS9B1_17510 [Candidatus Dormibacteraceae bacterium]